MRWKPTNHPVQPANLPSKSQWGYSPDVYQTNPAGQEIDKRITLTASAVVSDQKAILCEDKDAYLIIIWPCSVHRGLNLPWYGPRCDRILGTAAPATNCLWGKRYSNKLSVRSLEFHRIYTRSSVIEDSTIFSIRQQRAVSLCVGGGGMSGALANDLFDLVTVSQTYSTAGAVMKLHGTSTIMDDGSPVGVPLKEPNLPRFKPSRLAALKNMSCSHLPLAVPDPTVLHSKRFHVLPFNISTDRRFQTQCSTFRGEGWLIMSVMITVRGLAQQDYFIRATVTATSNFN